MSRLIRKSWTDLPRPVAGPLHRADDGTLWGLVAFGWPEELTSPDASWWRDLATAATATANNLEAELSRDETVYAEHEESAADAPQPMGQPVGEPLGLREAALGRPPYAESPPVGTHPQAEERTQ